MRLRSYLSEAAPCSAVHGGLLTRLQLLHLTLLAVVALTGSKGSSSTLPFSSAPGIKCYEQVFLFRCEEAPKAKKSWLSEQGDTAEINGCFWTTADK